MREHIVRLITTFCKETGEEPKSVKMHPQTLSEFREEYPWNVICGIPIEMDAECPIGSVYVQ